MTDCRVLHRYLAVRDLLRALQQRSKCDPKRQNRLLVRGGVSRRLKTQHPVWLRWLVPALLALLGLGVLLDGQHSGRKPYPWNRPVTVEAIGRDFSWWFRYPGPDGVRGTADDVQLGRQLYLPPNVPVTLVLKSEDYIYVMSIPGRDLREIAVPDLEFELSFRTQPTEEFDLLVDSLCSFRFFHDEVMGHVVVAARDDYTTYFGTAAQTGEN